MLLFHFISSHILGLRYLEHRVYHGLVFLRQLHSFNQSLIAFYPHGPFHFHSSQEYTSLACACTCTCTCGWLCLHGYYALEFPSFCLLPNPLSFVYPFGMDAKFPFPSNRQLLIQFWVLISLSHFSVHVFHTITLYIWISFSLNLLLHNQPYQNRPNPMLYHNLVISSWERASLMLRFCYCIWFAPLS